MDIRNEEIIQPITHEILPTYWSARTTTIMSIYSTWLYFNASDCATSSDRISNECKQK